MANKPTGVKITRNGANFSATWTNRKTGRKDVSKVEYRYRVSGGRWHNKKITRKVNKVDNFYKANLGARFTSVEFQVKTLTNAWSGFAKASAYEVKFPNAPSTSVSEETYPSAKFSWTLSGTGAGDNTIFTGAYWRVGLEENAGSSPGNVSWDGWNYTASDGSYLQVENVGVIAGKKYTRWFQMYSHGPLGDSWGNTQSMRYAMPNEPTIVVDEATKSPMAKPDRSYFYVYFRYTIERTPSTPLESIMPQYLIGTPKNALLDPPNSGWTDTVTTAPPAGTANITGAASFNTNNIVEDNQCLWVRVVSKNSSKQNQQTPSDPFLVYKGELSKPDEVDVGPIDETSLRSIVKAKNNSGVPGSFITVYRLVDDQETCIGVIPNGKDQTVIQFSEMVTDPIIRLYTMAGYYEVSSALKKTTDQTVDITKLYFRLLHSDDEHDYETVATEGTENPAEEWWFERSGTSGNYTYTQTTDTTVVVGKSYFKRIKYRYVLVDNPTGSPVLNKWYEIDGESSYSVDPKWKSEPIDTTTTIKVPQNITAGLATSNFSGNVRVNWDWPWKTADVAELSWSKNPDSWESTQEPSKYELKNAKPSSWVISDLETGSNWYIRVRLGKTGDNGVSYGPYGNANPWPFSLTSLPATPLISASKRVITADGETTVSWVYSSADGTPQNSATVYEVVEENGQKVYNELITVGSEQYVNLKASDEKLAWNTGEEHTVVVSVRSEAGETSNNLSNEITITIAEPVTCDIVDLSIEDGVLQDMPITFKAIEKYIPTNDVVVEPEKEYYTRSDIAEHTYSSVGEIESVRYQEVSDPEGNPSENGWYEYDSTEEEYVATQDTEVVEGKTYYVQVVENPSADGWYEYDETEEIYILTQDTTMVSGKDYYIQNVDPEYSYSLVESPSGNPHTNGYFERKPIEERYMVSATITRAEDFKQDRPDDSEFDGYAGETVYSEASYENRSFTINTSDLIGYLDDRADYILTLSVQDDLGQFCTKEYRFTVNWSHQAFYPSARVEIDQEEAVAFLYPEAPKSSIEYVLTEDEEIDDAKKYYISEEVLNPVDEDIDTYFELSGAVYVYTEDTSVISGKTYYIMSEVENPIVSEIGSYYEYTTIDVCDIYRLSVDKPELIYQGANFGETYVDPYPAIGEYGGHRFVCRTSNGDYITEESEIAWVDTGAEDGDRFETHGNIIDFDGEQAFLLYEVDLSSSWSKDFQETRYLGGSIQGDWNSGVSRTGSMNVTAVSDYDQELIRTMHRLANYPGVCHVRTKDGASYSADVQVNETYEYTRAPRFNKYDLSITRVDSETLDGMTLEEWRRSQEESE